MKITIYELLGKIKDGKAPKKIRFKGREWDYDEEFNNGLYTDDMGTFSIYGNELLEEVEILEEEKKIPEKLPIGLKQTTNGIYNTLVKDNDSYELNEKELMICKKIHEIIDYLDYLKSKGE